MKLWSNSLEVVPEALRLHGVRRTTSLFTVLDSQHFANDPAFDMPAGRASVFRCKFIEIVDGTFCHGCPFSPRSQCTQRETCCLKLGQLVSAHPVDLKGLCFLVRLRRLRFCT